MNVATQSKISYSETLKARKNHLSGLVNPLKTRTGKANKIDSLTIIAISTELSIIEQQLKKWA